MIPAIIMSCCLSCAAGIVIGYLCYRNSGYDEGFEAGEAQSVKQAESRGHARACSDLQGLIDHMQDS